MTQHAFLETRVHDAEYCHVWTVRGLCVNCTRQDLETGGEKQASRERTVDMPPCGPQEAFVPLQYAFVDSYYIFRRRRARECRVYRLSRPAGNWKSRCQHCCGQYRVEHFNRPDSPWHTRCLLARASSCTSAHHIDHVAISTDLRYRPRTLHVLTSVNSAEMPEIALMCQASTVLGVDNHDHSSTKHARRIPQEPARYHKQR